MGCMYVTTAVHAQLDTLDASELPHACRLHQVYVCYGYSMTALHCISNAVAVTPRPWCRT